MPCCSVKQCGARRKKDQPTLTLHRFPVKEESKKKWLEVIGPENINPLHKLMYVCSKHFNETSFNKTLNVARLYEGALPAPHLLPNRVSKTEPGTSREMDTNENSESSLDETQNISGSSCTRETRFSQVHMNKNAAMTTNPEERGDPLPHERLPEASNIDLQIAMVRQNQRIKYLKLKHGMLKKKMKTLYLKIRRRDEKIDSLFDVIEDVRNRNLIDNEEALVLKDFLRGQIRYKEEIRNFALMLHFFSPKAYRFIRSTYNTCLPNPSILSRWYKQVDANTKAAFDDLRRNFKGNSNPNLTLAANLEFDGSQQLTVLIVAKGKQWP